MNKNASDYYDKDYLEWQLKTVGEFGGYVNSYKFNKTVKQNDVLLDFGCGGGFLLKNFSNKIKIGIEPNENANEIIVKNGNKHFLSPEEAIESLGENSVDTIISNMALEHTLHPLKELQNLYKILKKGGKIHFVVPCDSHKYHYDSKDINYHLYSWSPQNLGNLFSEAGFKVNKAGLISKKWPPFARNILNIFGYSIFNLITILYSRIPVLETFQGKNYRQVEVIAEKSE